MSETANNLPFLSNANPKNKLMTGVLGVFISNEKSFFIKATPNEEYKATAVIFSLDTGLSKTTNP
ncbi:hypothetical protein SDC9_163613 [bioreactor metagenome]|uniref:Uncharacterized protein n=1 Tax=bioreactor metagenome TaxID=1076179 RepID=A0A645FPC1_9ZZZZ